MKPAKERKNVTRLELCLLIGNQANAQGFLISEMPNDAQHY